MTACERCGEPDAAAVWAAWWGTLDLPILMPAESPAPWCPACMTGAEETAFLAGLRSARVLFADRYATVSAAIDARLGDLVSAAVS